MIRLKNGKIIEYKTYSQFLTDVAINTPYDEEIEFDLD
tara:strand:+ start:969 stop:1082 length:114 start_codon:yes stop_codon:yes gene_type:complete